MCSNKKVFVKYSLTRSYVMRKMVKLWNRNWIFSVDEILISIKFGFEKSSTVKEIKDNPSAMFESKWICIMHHHQEIFLKNIIRCHRSKELGDLLKTSRQSWQSKVMRSMNTNDYSYKSFETSFLCSNFDY